MTRNYATCYSFFVRKQRPIFLEKYYRRSARFLTDLIREGKRQGLFQVDSPAAAASQILAIIDGIKVQLHLFGPETDLEKMKRGTKKFVLNALRTC